MVANSPVPKLRRALAILRTEGGSALLARMRAKSRFRRVQRRITRGAGFVVQSGPFAGMKYLGEAYYSSNLPKLLGAYEAELHAWLRKVMPLDHGVVVNIGCGEGYYAVGLALKSPGTPVYAFDLSTVARAACLDLARINGVSEHVSVEGECRHQRMRELLNDGGLIVCDCEGAELELLDPESVPELKKCKLLVEFHDFIRPGAARQMVRRFEPTHHVEVCQTADRNPAEYPALSQLSREDQELALAEGRPTAMEWGFMVPKNA